MSFAPKKRVPKQASGMNKQRKGTKTTARVAQNNGRDAKETTGGVPKHKRVCEMYVSNGAYRILAHTEPKALHLVGRVGRGIRRI